MVSWQVVPVIIYRQLLLNISYMLSGSYIRVFLAAFESHQKLFDIKVSRKTCYILNNLFNNRTTLADFDGRYDKCTRVFPSVPISLNLPKVTIATEPRKYSKYNGYVASKTKAFGDICFSSPLPTDCHAGVYIWRRRLRTFPVSVAPSLFFSEHFHLRIFFLLTLEIRGA